MRHFGILSLKTWIRFWIVVLSVFILLDCTAILRAERGLVFINASAGKENVYKASFALLIGVSDYQLDWPDLPGVIEDVKAVEGALHLHGFQVTTVLNPTRGKLEDQFDEFINKYGFEPDNRLLIYFAGHGHTLKLAYGGEMGYVVPVDSPSPERNRAGFLATAMDMQMIEVYARRIQAKHALFLFDSCFSGSIFSLSRSIPENISYKTTLPVRQFLTSGSADEKVPDESVFRRQFISALKGEGDLNRDGYVTGAELGEFLQNKVVNYSRGTQHPQYGKIRDPNLDKGDFVFMLNKELIDRQPDELPHENMSIVGSTGSRVAGDPEKEMWDLVKGSEEIVDVETFLTAYPNGRFAGAAKLKARQLKRRLELKEISIQQEVIAASLAEKYPQITTRNISKYIGNNTWKWTAFIEADQQTLSEVACVEYTLHETFPNPVRRSCERNRNFAISTNGWGVFQLQVKVIYNDKSELLFHHMLNFQ